MIFQRLPNGYFSGINLRNVIDLAGELSFEEGSS